MRFLHAALFLILTSYSYGQTTWVEVWADEFNYTGSPDASKWSFDLGGNGWGNQELQYYTDHSKNAFVGNGYLTIKTIKEVHDDNEYTSARLVSKNKGDWKYGKIDVMAKIPTGLGIWSAIWMLPTENTYGGWPASGEIDIMENVGYDPDKIHGTIHTESYNHQNGTQIGGNISPENPFESFHKYSVEWYENKLVFLFDDTPYLTIDKQPEDTYAEWPFDQYFHILVNTAVGGSWGGAQGVDDDIFPQEYLIDYVRVYTQSSLQNEYNLTIQTTKGGHVSSNVTSGKIPYNTLVNLSPIPDDGYEFVRWKGTYTSSEDNLSFNMLVDVEVIPVFIKKGELILNGGFDSHSANWVTNPGSSTASFDANSKKMEIVNNTAQPETWDIQLQQYPISLKAGHSYLFSYTISTTDNITLNAGVGMNQDPWSPYFLAVENIQAETADIEHTFTMNIDDPSARVFFDLGKTVGNFSIDNISLIDLSTITANTLPAGSRLLVFPNPAHTYIKIEASSKIESVYLFQQDNEIENTHWNNNSLDVSNLPSGLYFLKVVTANDTSLHKIIIQ